MIELDLMIFRIEPQRGGKKLAQGETLGTAQKDLQALSGRNKLSRPFRAYG
jgi:hypothetical protein